MTKAGHKGKHVYHKPHEMVHIKNQYSKDLSLFYTEANVRSLFNWRRPLYSNICKFMSQQYLGYSEQTVRVRLSLLMQMQSVLTELAVFNLLTEDQEQRDLLYEVCKVSNFPYKGKSKKSASIREVESHSDLKQLSQDKSAKGDDKKVVVQERVNPSFAALFPTAKDFDKIFNWS